MPNTPNLNTPKNEQQNRNQPSKQSGYDNKKEATKTPTSPTTKPADTSKKSA